MADLNFKFPTPTEFLSWLQSSAPDTFHDWDCHTCPISQMIESTQGVSISIHPSGASPGFYMGTGGAAGNLPKWANKLALTVDLYNDEILSLSKDVVIRVVKHIVDHDKETSSRTVPKGKT